VTAISDVLVFDDFYRDPDAVRALALGVDYHDPDPRQGFQGFESTRAYAASGTLSEFERRLGRPLVADPERLVFGKFRIALADQPRRTKVHIDKVDWTAVVYLTPGLPETCGLAVYAHRQLGAARVPTADELPGLGYADIHEFDERLVLPHSLQDDRWEVLEVVEPRFNRLVAFPGGRVFHASLGGHGSTRETGRLTQHFFFQNAGG
jgi:hypothetical protein